MSRYFRRNISALAGYLPGEQPGDPSVVKLNTNENPYPPSPRVYTALRKAVNANLRLYPEPASAPLRSAAAEVYGVEPGNIIVGNGSDELLSILFRCFVGLGDRVALPVPTYSLYDTLIAIQEGERAAVEYQDDFSLPDALAAQKAALTFLCNPNSPSGTLVPPHALEELARRVAGILVVDEAYIDFADTAGASILPLIKRLPNLVVLRTFSKSFSLAGMRIGLAFADEEIISGMMKVKDSYNVNRLSMVAATAALEDLPWMRRNVGRIQRSRGRLTRALERVGFRVFPSHANFVLAKKGHDLEPVYRRLKHKGILVRYFDAPGLRDSLRISVGSPSEIGVLLRELESIAADQARGAGTAAPAEPGNAGT